MGTIEVKNLGKAYKVYPNRWSRLLEWIIPFGRQRHSLRWVLKDLNFTVAPGEAVGIIGINGAGKSTLLKLITGTAVPTTGEVKISGRVAALLELGMGFHSDFTGRQNVIMAGQLLGYTSEELIELMPSIEAFADIGHYIDQPVRVYSSGMQMRLAFSLATAKRPDVLIVDEALSVGDAFFQHKSFDRIRKFREQGTTLLIVSHDKAAIQAICDKAILLDAGSIELMNKPDVVMDFYSARLSSRKDEISQNQTTSMRISTDSGTKEAVVRTVRFLDENGVPKELFRLGQSVALSVDIECFEPIESLVVGFLIKDRLGLPVYGTNSFYLDHKWIKNSSSTVITYVFSFLLNVGEGDYSLTIGLHEDETHVSKCFHWVDNIIVFKVINQTSVKSVGTSWLAPKMSIIYER